MSGETLTAERLREVLHYDPATGVFSWLAPPRHCNTVHVGDVAGGDDGRGYRRIRIDGSSRPLKAHRLAHL